MKTAKETREVIRAFGAVAARTVKNRLDGKTTTMENLGYVKDIPEVWDALQGISEVPAEFLDLDDNEMTILIGDVRMEMLNCGLSHRDTDTASLILEWAYTTVRHTVWTFQQIANAPPTAVAV